MSVQHPSQTDIKVMNVHGHWQLKLFMWSRHITRSSVKIKIEMEKIINEIRLSVPDGQVSSTGKFTSSSSRQDTKTTLITLQVMYTKDMWSTLRTCEAHNYTAKWVWQNETRLLGKQWLHNKKLNAYTYCTEGTKSSNATFLISLSNMLYVRRID